MAFGIPFPFLAKAIDIVSENTVKAVGRGLKYIFCYTSVVKDLNLEIEKLNIEEEHMSREAEKEKNNGKTIEDYVLKWQVKAEESQESDDEVSPSCSCISCLPIPDPVTRFHIGRNAAKKAKKVAQLTDSGKEYLTREIAYLPKVTNMPNPDTTYEEFQSRKDAYQKLWDALVGQDSPLIHGISGMAGVGKTRMMEQLWEKAVKENIFAKVVQVNVGKENRDDVKLQQQIAGVLGCELESEKDVKSRASQLEESLRNGRKIFLILDNVWRDVHLKNIIGTPFDDASSSSKGSKILFTSRKKDVCEKNGCEQVVELETLSSEEALNLFEKTVGLDSINSLPDQSLVGKVCGRCGQLPLLIYAVGRALRGKSHIQWKDAHVQLDKGKFENIADVDPGAYNCIKLSIDFLPNDDSQNNDARSCLFLCSMFPEAADIDMKILIQLATGSKLISDGESRVLSMVEYLKTSALLINSGWYDDVKIHDVIRSVARSEAFKDPTYAFLQETCNSRHLPYKASYHDRKFLCLDVQTADVSFYEDRVCQHLHTLWLQSNHPQQFSDGFFKMFANLTFLMLQNVNIHLEGFSLEGLGNLWTLTLLHCDIKKTDNRLFPKNLKSLCFRECGLPRLLNVGNLKDLLKLEILQLGPVSMMATVISSLSDLEELHIPRGINDHENDYLEPALMEISKLKHLISLQFRFCDGHTFEGTLKFPRIVRYNLIVAKKFILQEADIISDPLMTKVIELDGNHWQPWEGLIAEAEKVVLRKSNVEVSAICNRHKTAFEGLSKLDIKECYMGHLASISHDEIISRKHFSELTILQISSCCDLKYLFCDNIAQCLVKLQELTVKDCESMEAIIMNEGGASGRKTINFFKLKSLTLSKMPKLTSFYAEKKSMHSGSTSSVDSSAQHQPLFEKMVAFPSLETLDIKELPSISVVWGNDCYNGTVSSFCKLTSLDVGGCEKLKIVIPQAMLHKLNNLESLVVKRCRSLTTVFPPSVANDLTHLKTMEVDTCKEMRVIVEAGEQVITDGILFPELTDLRLYKLQSLMSFWCCQRGKAVPCKVAFSLPRLSSILLHDMPDLKSFFYDANFKFHMPALKEVDVFRCGLSTLFTLSMFWKFQLETLKVNSCELLENIVEDLRGDKTCDKIITLSRLTTVEFGCLPMLKSFFHNSNYEFHMPVLKRVAIWDCRLSNALLSRSVFKNLKQLEELTVCDCRLLESIFEDARGDETLDKSAEIITLDRVSEVYLKGLPKFKNIFYGATYKFYMPSLKNVTIGSCGLSTLFTYSVFREIGLLELLHVSNCESLEHIVEEDVATCEVYGKIITLSQLKTVDLENLPNLGRFFHSANYEFQMPVLRTVKIVKCGLSNALMMRSVFRNLQQLRELNVRDCKLLESIFEDARGDETLDTSDKMITLDQISKLHLEGLPNLKSIFCGTTYKYYMPSLKYVTIVGCRLSVLFTCSVFREIPQLRVLHVSRCELLEHIVEEVEDVDTSEVQNGNSVITCSQLSSIILEFLPNLKSFGRTSSYVFNMPKLWKFNLMMCPQIEYFTSPETKRGPSSLVVRCDGHLEKECRDLNDSIRLYHKRRSDSSDRVGESSDRNTIRVIEEEKPKDTKTD